MLSATEIHSHFQALILWVSGFSGNDYYYFVCVCWGGGGRVVIFNNIAAYFILVLIFSIVIVKILKTWNIIMYSSKIFSN